VFERDGWRCGICHAVIDQALRWPHPGSATLDHIVPLADGGDHMPSNWQAAHAACNIEKGNLRRRRAA
jgi:5-methylcytosine-specific restriction endonuclease McrA